MVGVPRTSTRDPNLPSGPVWMLAGHGRSQTVAADLDVQSQYFPSCHSRSDGDPVLHRTSLTDVTTTLAMKLELGATAGHVGHSSPFVHRARGSLSL